MSSPNQSANSESAQTFAAPKLVNEFREILLWPLQLVEGNGEETFFERDEVPNERLKRLTDKNGYFEDSFWTSVNDLIDRGLNTSKNSAYAEFVYFHPFVQRFLYDDANETGALRIFERKDVTGAFVRFNESKDEFRFAVDRIHLYIFDTSVAILLMEVSCADQPLPLCLKALEQFRICFTPFYQVTGRENSSAPYPQSVRWEVTDETHKPRSSDFESSSKYESFIRDHHCAPVASHWEWLLEPLLPAFSDEVIGGTKLGFRQIEDERIPTMAYASMPINSLSPTRGDFARFAFCDSGDDSSTLPYSESFLKNFEELYCYDRFWDLPKNKTTRYLCCGYNFAIVGNSNDPFFNNIIIDHFRRHYCNLGLIAQFHKASLLALKDRMARSVSKLNQSNVKSVDSYRKSVQRVHKDFLIFSQRYWFSEVSNEIQARELFQWWTSHLGNQRLYDLVLQEVKDSDEFLETRSQEEYVDNTLLVTALGAIMVTATLYFVIAGPFFEWNEHYSTNNLWLLVGACLGATVASIWISRFVVRFIRWVASLW